MRKYHKHIKGYLVTTYKGKNVLAHRLVWFEHYGEWPNGEIDHINHDKTDNRIENLRVVNTSDNHKNQPCWYKGQIFGIWWDKSRNKWAAEIKSKKRKYFLGRYDDFLEACCARKSAEIKHGFHENHGTPYQDGSAVV